MQQRAVEGFHPIDKRTRRRQLWKRIWQHRVIYLFALPAIVWFVVFCYYPMYGVLLAFKNYKYNLGILGSPWVGLQWFQRFMSDSNFWRICGNTIKISALKILFGFPAPIILALMLNAVDGLRFKRFIQTVSYMPHFVSWVVVAALLQKILSPNNGLVNEIRIFINPQAEAVYYMGEPGWFYPLVILSDVWKGIGWGTIIYLAAISGIDPELYEAASIDGARGFQLTFHITLPCMMPTIGVLLIMSMGGILNAGFEQILLLQTTPTLKVSEVLDTYILRRGINQGQHGYSAAIGLVKSFITMVLVITVNAVSRRLSEVSLW